MPERQQYNIIMITDHPTNTLMLAMNGIPDSSIFKMSYSSSLNFEIINKKASHFFHIQFDHLRLFTENGVEILQEDLQFIKNNQLLYVSNEEDFDSSSSFSVYQIIRFLGEGGFGKVLQGRHKITNEMVAIKIIDTYKIGNAVDIDMVFREAELMKSLRHKNIVKILNCYTLPNMQVVIVMEFLQGGELLEYLESKGRLAEDEARYFFKQIVEAIYYCHSQKLIHRDLKLENIILTSKADKVVKIVDFGIAGVATNLAVDKLDVGSLSYMAPELLSGKAKRLGPPIDIWALGVILYGLVCGQLPFTKYNQQQTIQAILEVQYTLPPYLSPHLRDLLEKIFTLDDFYRIRLFDILNHPWLQITTDPKLFAQTQFLNVKKKSVGIRKELSRAVKPAFREFTNLRCGTQRIQFQEPVTIKLVVPPADKKEQENDLKITAEEESRFIQKDYNQVLEKYRKLARNTRVNLNPFQRQIEQAEKQQKLKNLKEKLADTNKLKSKSFTGSPHTSPNSQSKKTLKTITTSMFKTKSQKKVRLYHSNRSSLHFSQVLVKPWSEKVAMRRERERAEEVSPQQNLQFFSPQMRISSELKYKLQSEFLERKKHKEEVFYRTFRSHLRSKSKPIL